MRLHERIFQHRSAMICKAAMCLLLLGLAPVCPWTPLQTLAAETMVSSADLQAAAAAAGAGSTQTSDVAAQNDPAMTAAAQTAAASSGTAAVQTAAAGASSGTATTQTAAAGASSGTATTQTAAAGASSGTATTQTAAADASADTTAQTAAVDMQVILNDPELFEQYVAQLTLQVEELQRQQEAAANQKAAAREELSNQTRSKTWKGAVLNKKKGTVKGPNGRETYYNLNMSKIVAVLHKAGYEGDYWVRKDGVKMFGDYIMVAANYSKFRYGTIVETSLGTGIVCDTGDFAKSSRVALDIAAAW